MSLTILLGACDEACCCDSPTTNLGTITVFPDFATAQIDCQSPFSTIVPFPTQGSPGGIINLNNSESAPCSDIPVWYVQIRVGGADGKDNCLWHKTFKFATDFTAVTVNGRVGLKVNGVPLGENRQVEITIIEPKHSSGSNGCPKCSGKYSIKWQGAVGTSLIANQPVNVVCLDALDTKCCD